MIVYFVFLGIFVLWTYRFYQSKISKKSKKDKIYKKVAENMEQTFLDNIPRLEEFVNKQKMESWSYRRFLEKKNEIY